MNSSQILKSTLLDIIFEGKNKDYGAYELRSTYNRRITMAIIGMLVLVVFYSFKFNLSFYIPAAASVF